MSVLAEAPLPTLLGSRAKVPPVEVPDKPQKQQRRRKMPKELDILEEAAPAPAVPPMAHGFRVRNTFIDGALQRSPSLEAFYREREVSTCPSKHIGRLSGNLLEAAGVAADAGNLQPPHLVSPCAIQTPCNLQDPLPNVPAAAPLAGPPLYDAGLAWCGLGADYAGFLPPAFGVLQAPPALGGVPGVADMRLPPEAPRPP
eukprot:CAMPEP_0198524474 /NCGR_PEP_ID=MMETSP1462-20131121/22767_1 /TAXON_ID=1333877 /ORGANISM="Brandtodinium nutriculum, Strain RCC3387" /LENGTH=199 /DNA_ID=CAMNT_0044254203 /DNA_START=40 /DNA_END=636 /DNA_ORIENTATION=-